jgi:hypothetical protein
MRTIVTFKTTQQGDVDFSADVSPGPGRRRCPSHPRPLRRGRGPGCNKLPGRQPAVQHRLDDVSPHRGNYVEVRREGVKKF